jgi:tRNA-splicing ligase RtcB
VSIGLLCLKKEKKMYEVVNNNKFPIKMWTKGVYVEEDAKAQLSKLAGLPFIHKHLAVMPDCHVGKGATIGSVVPTVGAIVPAAVGVDLGCGMSAVRTSLKASDLPDNLFSLRSHVESVVPHGRSNNGKGTLDVGSWRKDIPLDVEERWAELDRHFNYVVEINARFERSNNINHLGTLGGGNHFIEICLDENDNVWVMLHSGSRGIGNAIGSHFIALAKKDMERWFINLPDKDLSYIPEGSEHFSNYVSCVDWAQKYAKISREIMMVRALRVLKDEVCPFTTDEMAVNCHHNYISKEHHFGKNVWVTRKGAVRARVGDLGIIPGAMGMKSFIVRGKGNDDSFHSCSHGAGRLMSRTQAKKQFSLDDHIRDTQGVECRKDIDVLDETPKAYKDIDAVMAAQSDLVDVVHTLKAVVCVKG